MLQSSFSWPYVIIAMCIWWGGTAGRWVGCGPGQCVKCKRLAGDTGSVCRVSGMQRDGWEARDVLSWLA